jgi:hypothetical protein
MSDAMDKMVDAARSVYVNGEHDDIWDAMPAMLAAALAAAPAAPTVEERRTVRLDNEGVEWVACDPYPTWYRRVHGELLTLDSLGDEFCGWPAPTVDEANEAYSRRDWYAEGYDDGSAAAAPTAPTVLGLVLCGRYRLLAPDHCDTTGCRAWHGYCGHDRCEEQHNVAIVGQVAA